MIGCGFVVALEKMETDNAIYHLAGQALVTVKVPGFRAGYGDRVSLKGRLRRPHPARNPGAFDYRSFLAQQDIYSTLYIGKAEQVVAIERLPGYWLDEQLVLPVRGAVREAIECNLAGRTLARIAIGGEAADSRRSA